MQFKVTREDLIKPLTLASGVVERKSTLPILSNVLICAKDGFVTVTGSDLEHEMIGIAQAESIGSEGSVTVPAKKLADICKSMPPGSVIDFKAEGEKAIIKSGRSRFTLSTIPSDDYPLFDTGIVTNKFEIDQLSLKSIMAKISFAMASNDVRYYLNGTMIELTQDGIRAVATDGHRLATSFSSCETNASETSQIIIPRKASSEIVKLLGDNGGVRIDIGATFIRLTTDDMIFTSKLIDGKFPDYQRVIPKCGDKIVIGDRQSFRDALSRASILSNEKYRGVRLTLSEGIIKIQANNPEQEVAEDEIGVDYAGDHIETGFNVSYLLDVLSSIGTAQFTMKLTDANSSALIHESGSEETAFVVMPMRL